MLKGVSFAKAGYRVGDIGFAIDSHVRTYGYSVVRKYIGHGVGIVATLAGICLLAYPLLRKKRKTAE